MARPRNFTALEVHTKLKQEHRDMINSIGKKEVIDNDSEIMRRALVAYHGMLFPSRQ